MKENSQYRILGFVLAIVDLFLIYGRVYEPLKAASQGAEVRLGSKAPMFIPLLLGSALFLIFKPAKREGLPSKNEKTILKLVVVALFIAGLALDLGLRYELKTM